MHAYATRATNSQCLLPIPLLSGSLLRLLEAQGKLLLTSPYSDALHLPTCSPPAQFSFIDIATLLGIVCGYLSTFLAWSYTRAGAKMGRLQVRRAGGVGAVAIAVQPAWQYRRPGCVGTRRQRVSSAASRGCQHQSTLPPTLLVKHISPHPLPQAGGEAGVHFGHRHRQLLAQPGGAGRNHHRAAGGQVLPWRAAAMRGGCKS